MIPARSGSKRLPGKNIRLLGGRPLISWSIELATKIPERCDVLLSTDDRAIAEIGRSAGALAPWLRPAELATDTASSIDVCLHALNWYEDERGKVDGLLLLQPTSPFRSLDTVLRGIELFRMNDRRPVLGVSTAKSHPMWCFKIDKGIVHPFISNVDFRLRSQDLPPAYAANGAFYLIAPSDLRTYHSFYSDSIQALIMDQVEESIDIDTELDWRLAESIVGTQERASPIPRQT